MNAPLLGNEVYNLTLTLRFTLDGPGMRNLIQLGLLMTLCTLGLVRLLTGTTKTNPYRTGGLWQIGTAIAVMFMISLLIIICSTETSLE
jgi:hypothetical protein